MKVEILNGELHVTDADRSIHVKAAAGEDTEEPVLVISLDDCQTWDPPGEGPDITLEDLQQISQAIERACGRFGIKVEFD